MSEKKEFKNCRFRNICWSLNQNQDDKKLTGEQLKAQLKKISFISYSIFQFEKGTETGNLHYQGYSELKEQQWFTKLKKELPAGMHFEKIKGTPQQNIDYCQKTEKDGKETYLDGPWEFGKPKNPYESRKMNADQKWVDIRERIKKGESYEQLSVAHPAFSVIYEKKIRQMIAETNPNGAEKKVVLWFCGEAGAGKTTFVKNFLTRTFPNSKILVKKAPTKTSKKLWFAEEHRTKKALMLEEVRLGYPNQYELISLFDGDDYLETKGGQIPNGFEIICVLSIDAPQKILDKLELAEDKRQVLRRIDRLYEVMKNERQLKDLENQDLSGSEFQKKYQPFVIDRTYALKEYLLHLAEIIEDQELKIVKLSEAHDKLVDSIEVSKTQEAQKLHDVESQLADLKKVILDWVANPKDADRRDLLLKHGKILDYESWLKADPWNEFKNPYDPKWNEKWKDGSLKSPLVHGEIEANTKTCKTFNLKFITDLLSSFKPGKKENEDEPSAPERK